MGTIPSPLLNYHKINPIYNREGQAQVYIEFFFLFFSLFFFNDSTLCDYTFLSFFHVGEIVPFLWCMFLLLFHAVLFHCLSYCILKEKKKKLLYQNTSNSVYEPKQKS